MFQIQGHFFKFPHIFFPASKFSFWPSAYQKETKTPGFQVELFAPGHEILGWYNFDDDVLLILTRYFNCFDCKCILKHVGQV